MVVSDAYAGKPGQVSVQRQRRKSNFDSDRSLKRAWAQTEATCLEGNIQQDRLKPALGLEGPHFLLAESQGLGRNVMRRCSPFTCIT